MNRYLCSNGVYNLKEDDIESSSGEDDEDSQSSEEDSQSSEEDDENNASSNQLNIPVGTGSTFLDKITMELMVSKNAYNRYISTNDTSQYREKQEWEYKIKRYRKDIEHVIGKCFDKIAQGTSQEETMSVLSSVNADTMTCFEQLCKIIVNDLEIQQDNKSELFTKCDISRYSLNNFDFSKRESRLFRK
jgi:predicted AlkP superfamily phosphohydrolase/phosphomutase